MSAPRRRSPAGSAGGRSIAGSAGGRSIAGSAGGRRSQRDTPRPSARSRQRLHPRRTEPDDRRAARINRSDDADRFPRDDHDDPGVAHGTATEVATPRPPRRWLLWLAGGMAALALVGGLGWVLLGSSLFDARSVQVAGTKELSADLVRTVAAVPLGTPMLRLDTKAIASRVAALPRVAGVQVRRDLDGTVQIEVSERTPVAVVRRGGEVHLIDNTGTDYATVPAGPPGLPELRVPKVEPGNATTAAALSVLNALPGWLRVQVHSVAATSPTDVVLHLDNGRGGSLREVRWGDAGQEDRKVAVLGPLLTQPGKIYDVSSPALPTIA